jgi:hypothetical protein
VAELEEPNVWLQLELNTTSNIADSLQLVLDAEAEHGKRLKRCNVHLVNELRNHVEALESKVAKMDADAGESSAASEKQFDEYRAKFVESGIGAQSLRASYYGICAPIHGGAPLAYYYLRWLKSEVDFLPRVFAGMNENFVSIVHSDRRCTADGGGGVACLVIKQRFPQLKLSFVRIIPTVWFCHFGFGPLKLYVFSFYRSCSSKQTRGHTAKVKHLLLATTRSMIAVTRRRPEWWCGSF